MGLAVGAGQVRKVGEEAEDEGQVVGAINEIDPKVMEGIDDLKRRRIVTISKVSCRRRRLQMQKLSHLQRRNCDH